MDLQDIYNAAALEADSEGIMPDDEKALVDFIQRRCSYRPDTEFFLFLGICSSLADLQSRRRGFKGQADEIMGNIKQRKTRAS